MAISFRHHETRSIGILASGLGEMIDQLSKMQQGGWVDPRLWMHDHRRAGHAIEHPARDHDP
jgi:hypothetical protein